MKETVQQSELFDITSGEGILPHGVVFHDGGNRKLVKSFTLREITGYEEDILADQRRADGGKGKMLVSPSDRITAILSRCTVSIGDESHPENVDPSTSHKKYFEKIWKRATSGDRSFVLNCLRRMSIGDNFTFNTTCPECKAEIRRVSVDLSTLDVYPPFRNVHDDDADQLSAKREELALNDEHTVTLPSGKSVTYRLLKGSDEDRFMDEIDAHKEEQPTINLMFRLISVDGKPSTKDAVKSLKHRDRRFLTDHFDTVEGGMDNEILIKCDECGHHHKQHLNFGQASFFFPSEA